MTDTTFTCKKCLLKEADIEDKLCDFCTVTNEIRRQDRRHLVVSRCIGMLVGISCGVAIFYGLEGKHWLAQYGLSIVYTFIIPFAQEFQA